MQRLSARAELEEKKNLGWTSQDSEPSYTLRTLGDPVACITGAGERTRVLERVMLSFCGFPCGLSRNHYNVLNLESITRSLNANSRILGQGTARNLEYHLC